MAVISTKGFYSKVFQEASAAKLKAGSIEARDWFRERAMSMSRKNTNVNRLMERTKQKQVTHIEPGRMYMFFYDPKWKKELPYYDRFPLIFPIEKYEDGSFLGINLHYLPPMYRARLMDALHEATNNKKYDHTTRLKVNYQILKSATKFKYFKPCVKKYLYSHVQSQFILVEADQWDLALMLPVDRFTKKSRNRVWEDSKRIILKG